MCPRFIIYKDHIVLVASSMMAFAIFFLSMNLIVRYCEAVENKRLLLNDPVHLENEIQQLKSTINGLVSTVQSVQNQLAAMQSSQGKGLWTTYYIGFCFNGKFLGHL